MIRPVFLTWEKATESLLLVAEKTDQNERDQVIEKIEALLDLRDKVQPQMIAPFTEEEKVFGQKLLKLETEVQKKLSAFYEQVYGDISVAQSKKNHMKSYVNPYANMMQDGAYYDTRK